MADVVINIGAVSEITAGTGLTGGTITGTGTIAASFGTSAGTICQGNDSRLTNGRTPTTHAATHATGGGDPVTLDQSQITDLTADLAAKVAGTRQVIAGTGLSGGGALSADVTLTALYGTSGSTACVGNDARLSNARTPTTHASTHSAGQPDAITITQAQVTSLVSDLALKSSTTHAATHATGGTDVLTLTQAQITGLTASLAAKALGATTMTAGTGLTGGGDLSANRSFAVDFGTSSTTATVGDDARLSFIAAGAGATTRTLQNKLRDVISVKDFGAVGDGVADDTVEIQAALTAGTGKSVYLPAGTYKTTAVLNVYEGTCFFAEKGTATIEVFPTGGTVSLTHGILINGNQVVLDGLKISGTNQFKIAGGLRTEYAKGIVADAAISGTVFTRPTITNCLIFKWGQGIELRRASTYTVTNNRLWGGAQFDQSILDAGTTDISIYGSTAPNDSFRGIITGNFCLGNQDVGIGVGINSGDHDVTVSNNVIQPLQEDGVTPLSDANNKSRYAIIVGYSGANSCRTVISSNVIRDYGHTGIDCQTGTPPGGDIVVANNVVSRCGFSVLYPSDAGLKGGIWVNGGADSITGNIVLDCTRVGIQYNSTQPIDGIKQHPRAVIANNNIARIAIDTNVGANENNSGRGILVTGTHTSGVLVSGNRIQATAGASIVATSTAGADRGDIHIVGNQITTSSIWGGIQISNSGSLDCAVSANKISGSDSATSNSGLNAGIWFTGRVHCTGNTINKFHRGIEAALGSTRVTDVVCAGNSISNTTFGIAGNSSTGPWIIADNAFTSVSSNVCHAGPYQGIVVRSMNTTTAGKPDIVQVTATATPAAGTWEVGDYVKNSTPVVGQPKGWYCTVRATHPSLATWVSEGDL